MSETEEVEKIAESNEEGDEGDKKGESAVTRRGLIKEESGKK
ncbi:hypothetical protein SCOR_32090 [Sulfidibacter corallicola]